MWEAVDVLPSGAATYEQLGNGLGTRFDRDVVDQVWGVRVAALDGSTQVWDRGAHAVDPIEHTAYHNRQLDAKASSFRYDVTSIFRNAYGAIRGASDSAEAPGLRSRDAHFSYDLGGRLVGASVANHSFAYSYDARQNLTSRTATLPSGAPTPDIATGTYVHGGTGFGPRQLAEVGTTSFAYDAAGRTAIIAAADVTRNWYDAFDRVRKIGVDSTYYTHHRYDAGGARVSTTWDDGRVEYYFGGGLTERDDRWELNVSLGGARQIARINVHRNTGYPLSGPETVVYLHQGLGHGPSLLTDMAGEVLEERHFEPYGAPLWGDTDYEAERHGWNGKPVDPGTGWSDHGARWHATRYGRWLSPDPPLKGPGGWPEQGFGATPYGFVAGNPVLLWDPDGRIFGPFLEWVAEEGQKKFAQQMPNSDMLEIASGACLTCKVFSRAAELERVRELRSEIVDLESGNSILLTPEQYDASGLSWEGRYRQSIPDPDDPSERRTLFNVSIQEVDGNYEVSRRGGGLSAITTIGGRGRVKPGRYPKDFPTAQTRDWSAHFMSAAVRKRRILASSA